MTKPAAKNQFVRYLLGSLLLIAAFATLIIVLYFPSKNPLGKTFDIAIVYILTRWVAFWWALAMLVLRLIFRERIRRSFIYILCATLNCGVGLLAVYLYAFHDQNLEWLHLCLINLLLGVIMQADAFYFLKYFT